MRDLLGHRGYVFLNGSNTAVISTVEDQPRTYYYAPGTTTAIIAGGAWRPTIESSTLAAFKPGDSHHLTSEDDGLTYIATLGASYRTIDTTLFAAARRHVGGDRPGRQRVHRRRPCVDLRSPRQAAGRAGNSRARGRPRVRRAGPQDAVHWGAQLAVFDPHEVGRQVGRGRARWFNCWPTQQTDRSLP